MPASKFDRATIKKIIKVIRQTNSEQSAWEAAGISKSTYYSWKRKHESFLIEVEHARAEFLEQNFNVFRTLGLNRLYEALTKGVVQTHVTVVKELVETKDKEGNRVNKLTTTQTTSVEKHLGTPQWAIERVLGRTVDEIDAVNKLIEAGWFDSKATSKLPEEVDRFNNRIREILTKNAIE